MPIIWLYSAIAIEAADDIELFQPEQTIEDEPEHGKFEAAESIQRKPAAKSGRSA